MLLVGHTLPRSRFSSQVPHSFYESKTFYLNPSRGERDCTAILYPFCSQSFKEFQGAHLLVKTCIAVLFLSGRQILTIADIDELSLEVIEEKRVYNLMDILR